jgi:uncharacterized protein YukE
MAVTSLTQAEAQAKINQVDDAMNSARQCVKNLQDHTQQMTSSSWQGNQSTQFGNKMSQVTDEMTTIVNRLTQVAETGKNNMTALVNQDSE